MTQMTPPLTTAGLVNDCCDPLQSLLPDLHVPFAGLDIVVVVNYFIMESKHGIRYL